MGDSTPPQTLYNVTTRKLFETLCQIRGGTGGSSNGYYVMAVFLSRVLTGKVRRVGNSMAVIIPKELLAESGANAGDTIKLSLAIPKIGLKTSLASIAGLVRRARPFARGKSDRL